VEPEDAIRTLVPATGAHSRKSAFGFPNINDGRDINPGRHFGHPVIM
jgi:hypothetical protein